MSCRDTLVLQYTHYIPVRVERLGVGIALTILAAHTKQVCASLT